MNMLTVSEIQEALTKLNGWTLQDAKLYKKLTFVDFTDAFSFMTQVAMQAEKMNHHPEWKNVYNRVEVWLFTHDAGRVTDLDIQLAKRINQLYSSTRLIKKY